MSEHSTRTMISDALGDRMKAYETRESGRRFLPLLPVYARIDGRCFSSFTKGMDRPYDLGMIEAMIRTTEALVAETHARIGYTQSDEISLVWHADRYDISIFFDHRISKMISVLASFATIAFAQALLVGPHAHLFWKMPHFDCRVFQLPTREEAANAVLWREQDATKNAVSMAAHAVYSHKALHGKSGSEKQEMLFAKGINFNDYPACFKRGTFVRRAAVWREFTIDEIARIPESHRPEPGAKVQRSEIKRLDMPKFRTVTNRAAVIFDGAEPEASSA